MSGHGVPHTVNVVFAKTSLSVSGTLSDYESLSASGNVMHRRFCPACPK